MKFCLITKSCTSKIRGNFTYIISSDSKTWKFCWNCTSYYYCVSLLHQRTKETQINTEGENIVRFSIRQSLQSSFQLFCQNIFKVVLLSALSVLFLMLIQTFSAFITVTGFKSLSVAQFSSVPHVSKEVIFFFSFYLETHYLHCRRWFYCFWRMLFCLHLKVIKLN